MEILPVDNKFKSAASLSYSVTVGRGTSHNVCDNGTQDTDVPLFDDSSVRLELSDENIETFVSVVESAYKNSFECMYIGFSAVGNYLVERKYLRTMYNSLVDLFPFVHLVLAMTVSSPCARGNRVDCSSFFDDGNAEDDNVTNNKTSNKRNDNDEDMFLLLLTWSQPSPTRGTIEGVTLV